MWTPGCDVGRTRLMLFTGFFRILGSFKWCLMGIANGWVGLIGFLWGCFKSGPIFSFPVEFKRFFSLLFGGKEFIFVPWGRFASNSSLDFTFVVDFEVFNTFFFLGTCGNLPTRILSCPTIRGLYGFAWCWGSAFVIFSGLVRIVLGWGIFSGFLGKILSIRVETFTDDSRCLFIKRWPIFFVFLWDDVVLAGASPISFNISFFTFSSAVSLSFALCDALLTFVTFFLTFVGITVPLVFEWLNCLRILVLLWMTCEDFPSSSFGMVDCSLCFCTGLYTVMFCLCFLWLLFVLDKIFFLELCSLFPFMDPLICKVLLSFSFTLPIVSPKFFLYAWPTFLPSHVFVRWLKYFPKSEGFVLFSKFHCDVKLWK